MLLGQDLDVMESKSKKTKSGLPSLLRELSDDEDDITGSQPGIPENPDQPWSRHISAYMDVIEQVPEGWSAIKWWGVRAPSPVPILLTGTNALLG